MNVVIVFPSLFTDEQALAKVIKKIYRGIKNTSVEDNCIVCETNDVIDLAFELSKMFGVERVAIAKKVSTNFSELSASIVEAGSRIIIPGDKFYIKVLLPSLSYLPYRSRDVEFACTGILASKLASVYALPAKSQEEASRLVLAVVGKKSAYVSISIMRGPGGLIAGSIGEVFGSIYGSLSFISCMMAAKAGFDCTSIVLPYADHIDLEMNAKLAQLFAIRTGRKRQTILATQIKVPAKGPLLMLLKEKIISKILIQCQGKVIALPLATAVHPFWFVQSIIHDAVFAGKVPLAPIVSLSDELSNYSKDVGIELRIGPLNIPETKLDHYNDRIESEVRSAMEYMKKLDLKVGPNYLHDIIDAI